MAFRLRSFHPPPVIGFLLLLALAVAEYQTNPLPGHRAGFFHVSTRAGQAQHPCTVHSSKRQADSSGTVR